MYLHAYDKSGLEIATNSVAFTTEIFLFAIKIICTSRQLFATSCHR